jgi:hypothetical protein
MTQSEDIKRIREQIVSQKHLTLDEMCDRYTEQVRNYLARNNNQRELNKR